jgi:hypothetical protein
MIGDIIGLVENSFKTITGGITLIDSVSTLKRDMGAPFKGSGEPGVNL